MRAGLLCVALAFGCQEADPLPQWIVVVATDAPVPRFGDRLLVEVLDDAGEPACGSAAPCRRVFSAGDAASWPISFGVTAREGSPSPRVRAVLYRNAYVTEEGLPRTPMTIEATGSLPSASGVTTVVLELMMDCFGVAAAESAICDPATQALAPVPVLSPRDPATAVAAGSWPVAEVVACEGEAPAEMICIPGGVFLFGDYRNVELLPGVAADRERLVRISPFWMDRREVTAGTLAGLGTFPTGISLYDPDPTAPHHMCTPGHPGAEALPANCLSQTVAAAVCTALGKRLPTEAEWELAASAMGAEPTYPWGESPDHADVCAHAIVGRGRTDIITEDVSCRSIEGMAIPPGLVVGGSALDRTAEGIDDLGGNVAEWTAGGFQALDHACWEPDEHVVTDPICPTIFSTVSVRGSSWAGPPLRAHSATRLFGADDPSPTIGLRCVL